jgi:hypothetical protein
MGWIGWYIVILVFCVFTGLNPFAGLNINLTPLEVLGYGLACFFFVLLREICGAWKDALLLWWRGLKRVAPTNSPGSRDNRREPPPLSEEILYGEILPPFEPRINHLSR